MLFYVDMYLVVICAFAFSSASSTTAVLWRPLLSRVPGCARRELFESRPAWNAPLQRHFTLRAFEGRAGRRGVPDLGTLSRREMIARGDPLARERRALGPHVGGPGSLGEVSTGRDSSAP